MRIQNGVLTSISNDDINYGKLKIPNEVTHVGSWAFYGCTGLTAVTFPESLTHVGDGAFYGCTGLTAVAFPESLTHVGSWAFYGCTGLTSVTFPESLTHVGDGAFDGCTGLTSVTFPESLTHVGGGAFYGCTGLTSVTFPESLTHVGGRAFDGCTGLTAVTFKRFKQEDTYRVKCVDGMLMHILSHRNFSDSIKIYKAQYIAGMKNKKLILEDCYIAEQNGTFAHGETLKMAVSDLNFKLAKERGRDQYRHIRIDDALEFDEAVTMYRIITGACQFGTEQFIKTIGEPQETYTPREIIKITDGQYGNRMFADFWGM